MAIISHTSTKFSEIQKIENSLLVKGYRLTKKTNETDLRPSEYIKNQWSGSDDSFDGPAHYDITWWAG